MTIRGSSGTSWSPDVNGGAAGAPILAEMAGASIQALRFDPAPDGAPDPRAFTVAGITELNGSLIRDTLRLGAKARLAEPRIHLDRLICRDHPHGTHPPLKSAGRTIANALATTTPCTLDVPTAARRSSWPKSSKTTTTHEFAHHVMRCHKTGRPKPHHDARIPARTSLIVTVRRYLKTTELLQLSTGRFHRGVINEFGLGGLGQ
jgi:hypothetical protein